MFIADQITLEISFPAVCAGLARLTGGGLVIRAAQDAYREGSQELAGTGRVRYLPGALRLAEVRTGELLAQDAAARLPLCWEVTGPGDQRFPVLDADITLSGTVRYGTVLALSGTYLPPPGLASAGLDQEVIRRCAVRTARGFLARLASVLAHPAGQAGPALWPAGSAAEFRKLPGRPAAAR